MIGLNCPPFFSSIEPVALATIVEEDTVMRLPLLRVRMSIDHASSVGPHSDPPRIDLSGIDLPGIDLPGIDLSRVRRVALSQPPRDQLVNNRVIVCA